MLPLVAGLFILVEGLNRTGVLPALAGTPEAGRGGLAAGTAWIAGIVVAIAIEPRQQSAGRADRGDDPSGGRRCRPRSPGAILIGVDLGPNLSVTGSLATILWLIALRREGEDVGALAVPQARPAGHAARTGAFAAGVVGDVAISESNAQPLTHIIQLYQHIT